MGDYTRKVDFLKGLLEAEKLVFLKIRFHFQAHNYSNSVLFLTSLVLNVLLWPCLQASPTEKALANQFLAPGRTPTIASERMPASKTVHMQTKARCTGEMREELLGTVR